MSNPTEFRKAIEHAINCHCTEHHCMEQGCHTPDFVLAQYLFDCLGEFDRRPIPDAAPREAR